MAKRTFFDQWYRVAHLRVGLRHSVAFRQTNYRNGVWFVYHEPIHNGFFRVLPATHQVISKLSPDQTLGEIWRALVDESPEIAPGQEEFFELISSLYRANMVFVEGAVSDARLLERSFQKKAKPIVAQVSEVFFLKIPLWDPDRFLTRHLRKIDAVFSQTSLVLVFLLWIIAGYVFVTNADRAFHQGSGILQPHNLFSLYLATFITHIFHELAHAALCKRYGGDVRSVGLMLMMFAPLPFADVSSSWLMRNANHRAAIGAAGMFSDLVFCGLATLFWAYSPPGWQNEIALNVMFTTAVYTFVFNINPLMRFDGYYILSDVLNIPNLHQKSKSQFTAWWRNWVLSEPIPVGEEVPTRHRVLLITFFLCSFIYRNIVSFGIVIFLADQYFGIGMIGAAAIAYNSFLKPMSGGIKELASPHFRAKHFYVLRRASVVIGILAFAILVLPVPDYRRFEGVVESVNRVPLSSNVDGEISQIFVRPGDVVEKGAPLFVLRNDDIVNDALVIAAKLQGARLRAAQSMAVNGQSVAAIQREVESLNAQMEDNRARQAAMRIVAPRSGIWVSAPSGQLFVGKWVARGQDIGAVLDQSQLRFRGVLPQVAAYGLGQVQAAQASVRIAGALADRRAVSALSVAPYSSKELPSASLSPLGGGDVSISQKNTQQVEAAERFFLVDAVLAPDAQLQAVEGRTAWMRLRLPARPLAFQWKDRLAQFVQQRYKL